MIAGVVAHKQKWNRFPKHNISGWVAAVQQIVIQSSTPLTNLHTTLENMATDTEINEVTIFGRLIESGGNTLSPQAARCHILAIKFQPAERKRMHELAMKAQEGTLSPAEEIEIDGYERVGTLLSIWKTKARRAVRANQSQLSLMHGSEFH